MGNNELTFTLTGNFQYDLGILGLKRVLDFFEIGYDKDICSITVDINKNPWDYIGFLGYIYGYYFKGLERIKRKFDLKINTSENEFINFIRDKKNHQNNNICNFWDKMWELLEIPDDKKLKLELAFYPALSIFNVSHLNAFNASYKKTVIKEQNKEQNKMFFYNLYISKFKEPEESLGLEIDTCNFCRRFKGVTLNRNNFLFAPSAMNKGWFEQQNYKICSFCSSLNLFATYGMINAKGQEKYLIYSSNLKDLDEDNRIIANNLDELVFKYIENINVEARAEIENKEKMFITILLNNQNPNIDFLPLKKKVLSFLTKSKNKDYLNKLKKNDFVGIVKEPVVYGFKDTIKRILNEEPLFDLADFIALCIIKENNGNKNFKGFDQRAIETVFIILELSIAKKGGNMSDNVLNEFKEFGEKVRARLYAEKSPNAAKNKAISLASNIRDAINESKEKFMETILQIEISSNVFIPSSLLEDINKKDFNYKEAGLALALSLMSFKDKNKI